MALCTIRTGLYAHYDATVPLIKLNGGFLFVLEKKGGKDWHVIELGFQTVFNVDHRPIPAPFFPYEEKEAAI
jgi:hypothetical protein